VHFNQRCRRIETLRKLYLRYCDGGYYGIRLLANSLAGNTTMELVNLSMNHISSAGLVDIMRLLESMPRLKTISFRQSFGIFNNRDATQRFVSILQQKNSSVQELLWRDKKSFPCDEDPTFASIQSSLMRNRQLNHVDLLLVPPPPPPPPPQQQQQQHLTNSMMLKISHKLLQSLSRSASATMSERVSFYNLFQVRPALLEKRIKQLPLDAAAAAASVLALRMILVTTANRRRIQEW
jgi:hypothetical protein